MPKFKPAALVSKREASTALGISRTTFDRHWAAVLTDYRTPGGNRKVYADELAAAVGHWSFADQKAAVHAVRQKMGRLETIL